MLKKEVRLIVGQETEHLQDGRGLLLAGLALVLLVLLALALAAVPGAAGGGNGRLVDLAGELGVLVGVAVVAVVVLALPLWLGRGIAVGSVGLGFLLVFLTFLVF